MAVGNDIQWRRLVEIDKFACCATPARYANAGRHVERSQMYEDLRRVFARFSTEELSRDLTQAKIPWAPVNDVKSAGSLPAISRKTTRTRGPDGQEIVLQPLPVDRQSPPLELSFPPSYGQHTQSILREVGFSSEEIRGFVADGTAFVAG
jgi:crotonobetainyl-CoA:carnitine CoA-transferase CaiB-like acyl-CoA transferase